MLEFNVIFNGKTYGITIYRKSETDYTADCKELNVLTVGKNMVSVLAEAQQLIRQKLGLKVFPDYFKR